MIIYNKQDVHYIIISSKVVAKFVPVYTTILVSTMTWKLI